MFWRFDEIKVLQTLVHTSHISLCYTVQFSQGPVTKLWYNCSVDINIQIPSNIENWIFWLCYKSESVKWIISSFGINIDTGCWLAAQVSHNMEAGTKHFHWCLNRKLATLVPKMGRIRDCGSEKVIVGRKIKSFMLLQKIKNKSDEEGAELLSGFVCDWSVR